VNPNVGREMAVEMTCIGFQDQESQTHGQAKKR
jgi:hypothetical protein